MFMFLPNLSIMFVFLMYLSKQNYKISFLLYIINIKQCLMSSSVLVNN